MKKLFTILLVCFSISMFSQPINISIPSSKVSIDAQYQDASGAVWVLNADLTSDSPDSTNHPINFKPLKGVKFFPKKIGGKDYWVLEIKGTNKHKHATNRSCSFWLCIHNDELLFIRQGKYTARSITPEKFDFSD